MAKIQGITIGIDADASKFNKSIKKMNSGIKGTQQEVYNLTKSLEFKWDAGKFTRAQKLAQTALNDTNEKAKILRERLQFLDEQGTDKSTQEYRKLEQQLASTERQALQMEDKLKKINDLPIENLTKKFKDVGASIESAGQALVPVSAAAAALIAGFATIGISAISLGDDIGTTAQQLNIATDQLQKWRYIAEQTDVDNAKLEMGFRKIQAGLGALAVGDTTDPIAIALEELGYTAEQASLGMEENFDKVINSLANMKDATEQAYLANEIFGTRVGALIIPLLNEGGDALAELGAEFETFNNLTDDQVQALDAYEDEWQRVIFGFKAVTSQIGASLLPTFKQLSNVLQNNVLPVFTKIAEMFTNLTTSQRNLILSVLAFTAALAPTLLIVGKLTGAMGGLVKGVYVLRGALTALAAHPIILVIVGVIALLVLLYKRNEEFKDSINGLVSTLSDGLAPILNTITESFKTLLSAITPLLDILTGPLGSSLAITIDTLSSVVTSLMPLINILITVMMPLVKAQIGLTVFLAKALSGIVNVISKLLLPVLGLLGKAYKFVASIIGDTTLKAVDGLKQAFIDFKNAIPGVVNSVIKGVESMINFIIKGINLLITEVNKVSDLFGKTFDKVNEVDIKFNYDDIEDVADRVSTAVGGFVNGSSATTPITADITQEDVLPANILTDITPENSVSNLTQIDNSTKDITIEVTVQNYGDELDTDALIDEINLKLAEAM